MPGDLTLEKILGDVNGLSVSDEGEGKLIESVYDGGVEFNTKLRLTECFLGVRRIEVIKDGERIGMLGVWLVSETDLGEKVSGCLKSARGNEQIYVFDDFMG